jgi:hypothetical protein
MSNKSKYSISFPIRIFVLLSLLGALGILYFYKIQSEKITEADLPSLVSPVHK